MARTTITGYSRQYGSNKGSTPAVHMSIIQFTIDISQASSTGTGKFLPKGCIPVGTEDYSGGGSGASTVDIGLVGGTVTDLANELVAFQPSNREITGDALGVELTALTEITAGAGGVAGTGNVLFGVYYIMLDDGSA